MPRTSDKERCKVWHKRIAAADKVYEEWERTYRCKTLEDFYLGHQWRGLSTEEREQYVINLVFPTIETKLPSLLYFRPQAVITPRAGRADDPMAMIEGRARLRQDVLNTFLADRRLRIREQTLLSIREAFFRFGVIEVGYTGDFIDNPTAGKPVLKEDGDPMVGNDGQPVLGPERILQQESLFVRRIPAARFRVSVNANNMLEWNDWVGYYEWHYLEDLKRNPNYSNTEKLKAGGKMQKDYEETPDPEKNAEKRGMVKVWKVWDIRSKTRYVFADNHEKFLLEEPYDDLPFAVLKFHDILDEFYPLPPVFNWLHPQMEFNMIREDMREYRYAVMPRYTYKDGAIDEPELVKLEKHGHRYAKANTENPIQQVPMGDISRALVAGIPQTKDDFREISAVGGEQRGEADSETATQAQIIEMRSNIRESFSRFQVAEWLTEIFTLILKTIEKRMALPYWVFTSVDPSGHMVMEEAARVAEEWKLITSEQLGDLEYDVQVDVESLSPASQETKKREFMEAMQTVFGNPTSAMILMAAPSLLRRTLEHLGIRSDVVVQEVQQALAMVRMMHAGPPAGASPTGGGPGPGPTPSLPDIRGQLDAQIQGLPQ